MDQVSDSPQHDYETVLQGVVWDPLLWSSAGYAFETLAHRVIEGGRPSLSLRFSGNSGNSRIRLSTLPLKITVKGTDTFRKADELSDLLRAAPGFTKVKAERIDIYH